VDVLCCAANNIAVAFAHSVGDRAPALKVPDELGRDQVGMYIDTHQVFPRMGKYILPRRRWSRKKFNYERMLGEGYPTTDYYVNLGLHSKNNSTAHPTQIVDVVILVVMRNIEDDKKT
jgi:hypothetical protein